MSTLTGRFLFNDRPPFTIQRISELTLEPEKYYRSCKKILYAYEKLVNVSDPEDRWLSDGF